MLPHSNSNVLSGTPLQILHLMWCVSDVVLYFGGLTVPEYNGGGAMFCMSVIPIDGGTPLGLHEVISFFLFCPPPAIIALKWSQTCIN